MICPAEDTVGNPRSPPSVAQRVVIAGMKTKQTGMLESDIELAVGMAAMVMVNIATEADLSNGTRGTVTEIILDPRDRLTRISDDTGLTLLKYPPVAVMFKPPEPTETSLPGLTNGILPIFPKEITFTIINQDGSKYRVTRRQFPITPGYAFTDFKSQGQTIERVIIDLAKPPIGALNPFNAYVALSRSRGRDTIRLLRDFDNNLFTEHPSEELRIEDGRLQELAAKTRESISGGRRW